MSPLTYLLSTSPVIRQLLTTPITIQIHTHILTQLTTPDRLPSTLNTRNHLMRRTYLHAIPRIITAKLALYTTILHIT
jgi:hypothetical protein